MSRFASTWDPSHLWIARHLDNFRARQVLIGNGQQTLGVALRAIAAILVNNASAAAAD